MNFDLYTAGLTLMTAPAFFGMIMGTVVGIVIGALPGLTAMMAVSILVPVTYSLDPTAGVLMLLGVYCGANYGGSISATLVNIPGTPSAVMTTLDAYPLAKQGKAGLAIGIATMTSTLGGLFSVFTLALFSPLIASIALKFTSLELFSIGLFGLSVIAYISPGSTLKGLISGVIGLMLATIGSDPITAVPRFTFGNMNLFSGIQFIAAMIGLFGLSEVLMSFEKKSADIQKSEFYEVKDPFECFKYLKEIWGNIIRSSIIGTIVGAIPGAGGTIASIVSYAQEKKISKHPEELGKGSIHGITAAEASNNACTGGAMITLLSLGIPGDAVTAILIGAFVIHGLTPGPMLFTTNFDLVSAIFIGMFMINIFILLLGLFGAKYFARLMLVPKPIMNTVILILCVVGTYGVQNSMFDVYTMLIFAVLGYFITKLSLPKAPIVLALILGPLMESNLRRWIELANGDYFGMFFRTSLTNPIALIILMITAATLLLPFFSKKGRISEDMVGRLKEENSNL
ncbi:MAG: tripartite tricarboxylate transporter permease [Clostridia bacterium]